MSLQQTLFESREDLNKSFADTIVSILEAAIARDGKASLVVSGGSTPLPLFQALSQRDLAWSKVTITLADERWVDNQHDASNEKLVTDNLLVGKAAAAQFFALKTEHEDAQDAVTQLNSAADQPKQPFDVLILGMGEDAHTASLFPCCAQIQAGLALDNPSTFISTQPTTAPHQRMSYTLAALVKAKHIFLHLTGDKKRSVLEQALQTKNAEEKPIKAVVDNADVTLMWAP